MCKKNVSQDGIDVTSPLNSIMNLLSICKSSAKPYMIAKKSSNLKEKIKQVYEKGSFLFDQVWNENK